MKKSLVWHDLRCGLLRWKYVLLPFLLLLSLLSMQMVSRMMGVVPNLTDFLMSAFDGMDPIRMNGAFETIRLPIRWIVATCGCLYINLDYFLGDLTTSGHQIILKGGSRSGWFLSKCLWNLVSCLIYFAVYIVLALVLTGIFGGKFFPLGISEATAYYFEGKLLPGQIGAARELWIGVLLPFLTVWGLSLLQMTLCLFTRPILSFIGCLSIVIISAFIPSPLLLGNGAMAVRSTFVEMGMIDPVMQTASCAGVIVGSIAAGLIRFKHTDILGTKE